MRKLSPQTISPISSAFATTTPVRGKRMWGRLIVEYYANAHTDSLYCPDCEEEATLELEHRPLTYGASEIRCQRCNLALAMVSSQLIEEFGDDTRLKQAA